MALTCSSLTALLKVKNKFRYVYNTSSLKMLQTSEGNGKLRMISDGFRRLLVASDVYEQLKSVYECYRRQTDGFKQVWTTAIRFRRLLMVSVDFSQRVPSNGLILLWALSGKFRCIWVFLDVP